MTAAETPSPPPGAERAGVRWGIPERSPVPTSPSHRSAMGPSLSALRGGEGFFRRRGSQPDGKGRALAEGAGDVEAAAMAVEHVLDDRQAETGTAQLSRSGVVDPVEALGQARQMLVWDA